MCGYCVSVCGVCVVFGVYECDVYVHVCACVREGGEGGSGGERERGLNSSGFSLCCFTV